jgi:hypothetical protein
MGGATDDISMLDGYRLVHQPYPEDITVQLKPIRFRFGFDRYFDASFTWPVGIAVFLILVVGIPDSVRLNYGLYFFGAIILYACVLPFGMRIIDRKT